MGNERTVARCVVREHGKTFCEEAGIRLADKPAPLYQLLVLATLLSARIGSQIATAAARELFADGMGTPRGMADAPWQRRVDALGRGHYRRYDERTATMLGNGAELLLDRWHGDLRTLHGQADGDRSALRSALREVPGIGDVGVDIFLREVQAVWPDLYPFTDGRVARGAARVDLPGDVDALAALVSRQDLPRLAAGLVRLSLDGRAANHIARNGG